MSSVPAQTRRSLDIYVTLLVLALAVLAQGTLLSRVRFLGAGPNLLLVAVVCWSMVQSVPGGLVWGFLGGLGADLITGMALGASSLALMAPCLLAGFGRKTVFTSNLLLPMLLVALATPLHGWIILLIQQAQKAPVAWLSTTVQVILPETALNTLLTIVAFPLLRALAQGAGAMSMEK